jgi:hypothetical protein
MTQIGACSTRSQASPIEGEDGRQLGAGTMFIAIILPLYNQENWPYLDQLFSEVMSGEDRDGVPARRQLQRSQPQRQLRRQLHRGLRRDQLPRLRQRLLDRDLRAQAAELAEIAPVFGPRMAYGVGCERWPFPATRVRAPITAAGSADILVVGTTNDPATPYVWAQALADELENGHLITYHGEGHTAYNKSNSCVDDAVDDYFIDVTVPASDPDC